MWVSARAEETQNGQGSLGRLRVGVGALARDDLDARRLDHVVALHLEVGVGDDERPHVVEVTVRVQVALDARTGRMENSERRAG